MGSSNSSLQPTTTLDDIIAAARRKSLTPCDSAPSLPALIHPLQQTRSLDLDNDDTDTRAIEENARELTPSYQRTSSKASSMVTSEEEAREIADQLIDEEPNHDSIHVAPPKHLSLDESEGELLG